MTLCYYQWFPDFLFMKFTHLYTHNFSSTLYMKSIRYEHSRSLCSLPLELSIGAWPQWWQRCFSSRQMIKYQFVSPGAIILNFAVYIVYQFPVGSYRGFIPTHLMVGNGFRHWKQILWEEPSNYTGSLPASNPVSSFGWASAGELTFPILYTCLCKKSAHMFLCIRTISGWTH
jgi:hypothetical protein